MAFGIVMISVIVTRFCIVPVSGAGDASDVTTAGMAGTEGAFLMSHGFTPPAMTVRVYERANGNCLDGMAGG